MRCLPPRASPARMCWWVTRWAACTPRCSPAGTTATWRAWCCSTRPPAAYLTSLEPAAQRAAGPPSEQLRILQVIQPIGLTRLLGLRPPVPVQHLAPEVQQEMKALGFRSTASLGEPPVEGPRPGMWALCPRALPGGWSYGATGAAAGSVPASRWSTTPDLLSSWYSLQMP